MFKKVVSSITITAIITGNALALPQGGNVVGGNATINSNANTMNINQTTNRAEINWNSFDIGKTETVNFNSLNRSDITINKVIGGSPSLIQGMLNASHTVAILNEHGMTITKDAQINVDALIASTAKNYSFNGNKLRLTDLGSGKIINYGKINVSDDGKGNALLFAKKVENHGDITANNGSVHLASAKSATISLADGFSYPLTTYNDIESETSLVEDTGVINTGNITARNGLVQLTSKQLNDIRAGAINLTGVIDVSALNNGELTNAGYVEVGTSGDLNNDATILANGNNGYVSTYAGGTNNFTGEINSAGVGIGGKDFIYAGTVSGVENNFSIASFSDVNITESDSVTKNSISADTIREVGENANTVGILAKNINIEKLNDDKLAVNSSLELHGMYGGSINMLSNNDTLQSKQGRVALYGKNVDLGKVVASDAVTIESYGNTNAKELKIERSSEFPQQDAEQAYIQVYAGRDNMTDNAGKINIDNIVIKNETSELGARSQLRVIGSPLGQVNIDNINITTSSSSNNEVNAAVGAFIGGNEVNLGNVEINTVSKVEDTNVAAAIFINGNDITTSDITVNTVSTFIDPENVQVEVDAYNVHTSLGDIKTNHSTDINAGLVVINPSNPVVVTPPVTNPSNPVVVTPPVTNPGTTPVENYIASIRDLTEKDFDNMAVLNGLVAKYSATVNTNAKPGNSDVAPTFYIAVSSDKEETTSAQ